MAETDQIRRDIQEAQARMGASLENIGDRVAPKKVVARTKENISEKVEDVKEKVSPVRVAKRQTEKVRSGFREFMGADSGKNGTGGTGDWYAGGDRYPGGQRYAGGGTTGVGTTTGSQEPPLADRARDMAGNALEAAKSAPGAIQDRAESKPLAAGLLSFAAGFLLAAVIPPTEREHQITERLRDAMRPLGEEAKDRGKSVAQQLGQSAQNRFEDVKQAAMEATERVKAEAQERTGDLKEQVAGATDTVKGQVAGATDAVKGQAKRSVVDLREPS